MSRRTRIISALLLAPVAIGAVLFLPTPYVAALAAVIMLAGLWEWARLSFVNDRVSRAVYLVGNALLIASLTWGSGRGLFALKLAALIGTLFWLLSLLWLYHNQFASKDSRESRMIKLFAGSLMVVPAWAALSFMHAEDPIGPRWALYALCIAWAADTGAYFVGVRFGRIKLAPTISPGKTHEGLYGGLLAVALLSAAAVPLLNLKWSEWPSLLVLSLIVSLFSVAGDLFESMIKRHSGQKDSGAVIPGHGGLMDRIDSLLAVLPIFLIGKFALGW
jgi:phosphatidate cytidylyltransferase